MYQLRSFDRAYRVLVQSVTDHAIIMLSPDGLVSSWNVGAENIKGYKPAEILGRHFSLFYDDADQSAGAPGRSLFIAREEGRCESEGWRVRQDGTRFWAKTVIHAIQDDECFIGFAKITRDCTKERKKAVALEAMARNLRLALSFLPYGACLLDDQQRIVLFNPAFKGLFAEAKEGACLSDLIKRQLTWDGLEDAYATAMLSGVLGYAHGDPKEIILGTSVLAVRILEAEQFSWVAIFEDITERRKTEMQMLHSIRHDALTGLANRDGLDTHLDTLLSVEGAATDWGIICLDLDRFKRINDTFGHHAGDLVLKEAARRILSVLRPEDFACRLGGDEFVVVPSHPVTAEQALRIAERLSEYLHQPFAIGEQAVEVGVSIGFALSEGRATNPVDLMGAADMALYQAKRDGRGHIRCYDEELGIAVLKRRSIEARLRNALEADEFSLAYQPICSASGRDIKGFEALLRWQQGADSPPTSPAVFVPIAEELGIMTEIGGWVLDAACQEAITWPAPLMVAVNVSATQMRDRSLLGRVRNALDRSGLSPCRLEIEMTETAMIADHALTLSILLELRDMGVMIAVDDFGTGFSSLNFLHTLPFTRIKIDRSFISDITENANSIAIVRGVMRISQDLGLAVTAEGVETEEQRQILMSEACEDLQGFLFAKPMPGDQIPSFLTSSLRQEPSNRLEIHQTKILLTG